MIKYIILAKSLQLKEERGLNTQTSLGMCLIALVILSEKSRLLLIINLLVWELGGEGVKVRAINIIHFGILKHRPHVTWTVNLIVKNGGF